MKNALRQVFKPVQPMVTATDYGVHYQELVPDLRLSQFIYCYWQLKTSQKLSRPFIYRVIPDGCTDIFFDVNNVADCQVMGFGTSYAEFALGDKFHYAGIRFLPTAFSHLFKCNAAQLTDRDEHLGDIDLSMATSLVNMLQGVVKFETIKEVLDQVFLKKIASSNYQFNDCLTQALWDISKAHGTITLKTEIDTGISPRQLRRLFECYVGTSPKMFGKVVRFQYFFQLLTSSKGNHYNKLIYDAGYYDQPHFNRDFKSFFGLSPTAILKG